MSKKLSILHRALDPVAPGLDLGDISGGSVLPAAHDKIAAPDPGGRLTTNAYAGGHEWRQLWEHFLDPGHFSA